jgi:hypothetical protein
MFFKNLEGVSLYGIISCIKKKVAPAPKSAEGARIGGSICLKLFF